MKKYNSFFKVLLIAFTALFLTGCVHDDKYDAPNLDGYQCQDLVATLTIAQVKALHGSARYDFPDTSTAIMEGYVSSTDETGNIYKTIYIQDAPVNPTQGFTISVDAVSTYTKFPQGSKIYIKLAGLSLGTYGSLVQLGVRDAKSDAAGLPDGVSRIPEKLLPSRMFRSCTIRENIVPKVLKISEFNSNNNILGALIQVNDVEFTKNSLCANYAPDGFTVDRQIGEGWSTAANNYTGTATVRNSGFASFANQLVPAGNGAFIGVFSKFNSTFQLYINKAADLAAMKNFPRKDGIATNPCILDQTGLTTKTVAETKQLLSGASSQITGDFLLKVKVTANDEAANLTQSIYAEDETGGIRINVNKANLYQDARFRVGKAIYIKLKGLAVSNVNGEIQLGRLSGTIFAPILEASVYNTFFDSNANVSAPVPTERTIPQLTTADVGRWIKIKDVEVIADDLYKSYAPAAITLEDCSGNKIILKTNTSATFAGAETDGGKGDVYAIVTYANGKYQLLVPKQINANFGNARCDGTVPQIFTTIYEDGFDTLLAKWDTKNVLGTQVWSTTTYGNPRPSAYIDGYRQPNLDWLITKNKISLSGYKDAFVSFESDGRYSSNGLVSLELYVTENYTGDATTTNWTKLNAAFDTDIDNFNGFVSSGRVNLKNYVNKDVWFAFKYTSTSGFSTTWELDNFKVKGTK
ncbi:DUF5689 domain-containing protein [Kaistella jeonii]|uniref:DUF5689 domain-containing protein n=1 Tax=Kaistella jeonii TaxID=266749 RepID=A0A0C1FA05_9FLAO|nr:DUF5689 domain-containing protein [Kaistella jeonii]KIA89977.1 hypothetical protein OA86_05085 [Kaistella jeonii]SFB79942.1 hypothetical protein SAMN05421876_102277 [Kaistella jeonii]VEI96236.1 Uncharacterised protein [Kaistella jeonii]